MSWSRTTAAVAVVILGTGRDCSPSSHLSCRKPSGMGWRQHLLDLSSTQKTPLRLGPTSETVLFPRSFRFPLHKIHSRCTDLFPKSCSWLAISSAMTVANDLETAHSPEGVPSRFYCFLSSRIRLFKMFKRQERSHYFID